MKPGRPPMRLDRPPNRIREVREDKGLTIEQLADRLDMPHQMLSRYELGRTRVTLERLEQIATALGVPAYTLINPPAAQP